MSSFHIFFLRVRSGEGLAPPQIIVIKLKIKEMHFKNVDVNHWVHSAYIVHENSEHIFIANRLYLTFSTTLLS